jgi:small nuclear ribonucleoprotein (snRNP)-like protein
MTRRKIMMKKKRMMTSVAGVALVMIFFGSFIAGPAGVEAKSKVVAIEGVSYNVTASLADNLKSFVGKRVYVTLDSGKTLSGSVKAVGNHFLHLEKLDGKEYYDALIRIENISAIDSRFRNLQR